MGQARFLRAAARIEGVYVPSLYDVSYHADGTVAAIEARDGAPQVVTKRIVQDMDKAYFPAKTIVPSTEVINDRVTLELFRGCIAAAVSARRDTFTVRYATAARICCCNNGVEALKDSGYQEMTLSSLSTSDYKPLNDLCDGLMEYCEANKVHLSLPSLRADNFSMELQQRLSRGAQGGADFRPEAGSQRLRDVINKNLTEEDLLHSCRICVRGGMEFRQALLYAGIAHGDRRGHWEIARIADHVVHTWRESAPDKRRGVSVTVSTSWFVPKPHTAFSGRHRLPKKNMSAACSCCGTILRLRRYRISGTIPTPAF